MSSISWLVWAAAAAAGFAIAQWFYRRRETPGRGRRVLAGLRGASVALLLLLIFDPELPGGVRFAGGRAVLVDGSLSMGLPRDEGTRWTAAVERARSLGSSQVTLFGDGADAVSIDSLPTLVPAATHTRLLPALQAAAEAGSRAVTVVTDGAIEDADQVSRWLARLGLDLDLDVVATAVTNRGLVRAIAPDWVEAGEPIAIEFELAATGSAAGPVTVIASQDGREMARTVVQTPAAQRVAGGTLRFTAEPPESGDYARYDVAIDAGDAVPDDDVRTMYVHVTAEPAGAVLVSFAPDWEPRFLQPVLERSLGMPVRGFLRSGDGWVTLGAGLAVGARTTDLEVRRAVDRAELLVLHAFGPDGPAWARDVALEAPRLLVLPTGDGVIPGLPIPATTALAADWYLSADIPPSPVARLLAGIDARDVPPLSALRLPDRLPGVWSAALVNRGRRGSPYPLAVGGVTNGRRWVVALGEGFWRWAFWSDSAREVYERLWSALAGWLVEDAVAAGPDAVAPARRSVPRGVGPRWVAYGVRPDSVHVRLSSEDGRAVSDTVVAGVGGDTVTTATLAPGHYAYDVRAYSASGSVGGQGGITVESYSDEFTRAAIEPAGLEAAPAALAGRAASRRPLHSSIWPWVLLIGLLCVEWVLRRRWGLR